MSFSFVFEATVLGVQVILRLSVVPGECPPLLSKPACTQLGMIIDTEYHTVSARKLKVKTTVFFRRLVVTMLCRLVSSPTACLLYTTFSALAA